MRIKKIISLVILFAVCITTIAPQTTPTAAAASSEIDKLKAEAEAAWNSYLATLTGQNKIDAMTGKTNWDAYVAKNKADMEAKDSYMICNGVKVPRPRYVWELIGYPYYDNHSWSTQGVKIKSNWDVYLNGLCSDAYLVSVKSNKLKITGDSILSPYNVYSVRDKFQLIKPPSGIDYYIGEDGLAYVDAHSYDRDNFRKSKSVLDSNTVIVLADAFKDEIAENDLSFTMDLSELADGVYCFKETVWDTADANNKMSDYWDDLVVVVYNGKASLQAVDVSYDVLPKAPEGRVTYGKWWGSLQWEKSGWSISRYY